MAAKVTRQKIGRRSRALQRSKNSQPAPPFSRLGQELRALSDQAISSGTEILTLEEIRREVAQRRGGVA
jgi:hypothetical protein